MLYLQIAEYVLLALLLVPVLVFIVQIFTAILIPMKDKWDGMDSPQASNSAADVCLLMPAHNEALGIASVLTALLPQLSERTRLLVVADNCSDGTANIIRTVSAGSGHVEVVERLDPNQRGKGYALDFGIRHLASRPPAVVIIIDADCELSANAIAVLTRCTLQTSRPAQALYLMLAPAGSKLKTRLAEFAWLIKNKVRPLGSMHLGMPCQLMGSGMAFLWRHLQDAKLASGHIVEDMKLGSELALQGTPPVFCPEALVWSYFPVSEDGLKSQRQRWEHGHLSTILSEVPALLRQAIVLRRPSILGMALDLSIPPLALLVALTGLATLLAALQWLMSGVLPPLLLAGLAISLLLMAVLLSWLRYGTHIISFMQLISLPYYVIMKLPVYFKFIFKRQAEWIRTRRD